MGFWNWGRSSPEFKSDVEVIAEACLWLKNVTDRSFTEVVAAIKRREWEESYDRKDFDEVSYGFSVCNRKISGHVSERTRLDRQLAALGASSRMIILEAHEEYFGAMISIHAHGIYVDLKGAVVKKGTHAAKLRQELLRREGFTSLEQMKRELLG